MRQTQACSGSRANTIVGWCHDNSTYSASWQVRLNGKRMAFPRVDTDRSMEEAGALLIMQDLGHSTLQVHALQPLPPAQHTQSSFAAGS